MSMTPTPTTRRTPSTLARVYEEEEQNHKLSEQLRAMVMVGSLFCYCFATSMVLLLAFALVPFLPMLRGAFAAALALFTPADCEYGYRFSLQAPAGGLAMAAQQLSSFLSAVSSSVPSIASSAAASSSNSSSSSSLGSCFLSSMSSYAATAPAPAEILPIKSMASMLYNEPALAQLKSYATDGY